MREMRIGIIGLLLLVVIGSANAQQLDQYGIKKGVKLSGGVSLNQNLYLSNGVDGRFNPYSYVLSGNLNINAFGVAIPLSFTYSNQELRTSYPQPFNIVGLSPSYKNLTLHAGYRNLTYSQYTLSGHSFFGGGADYKKGKWSFSGMGGRFAKAIEYDSTENVLPVYKRWGYGAKVGYSNNGDEIALIGFYGYDDPNSLNAVPENLGVKPMENQVYSISIRKKLSKQVSLKIEGARSALVKDRRSPLSTAEKTLANSIYFVSNSENVVFHNAFKAGIDWAIGKTKLGANFERVDPEYRTLGAYYFNSDFQNVTVNAARPFIKDKLQLSGKFGFQRDDLDNEKLSRMNRVVFNANGTMKFSKKLSVNGAFSNFNSFVNVKPIDQAFVQNSEFDQLDTFNFVQVNQTVSGGMNYMPLENDNVIHNINVNGNYSRSSNENGGLVVANSMVSGTVAYSLNMKQSGLSVGLNLNGNQNSYELGESVFAGFGLNTGIPAFQKKLRISAGGRVSNNYENGELTALLYSLTNSYSLKLGKHQSVNLSLRYSGRKMRSVSTLSYFSDTFNEFMGTLNYSYNF